jgi:hypothetical protein
MFLFAAATCFFVAMGHLSSVGVSVKASLLEALETPRFTRVRPGTNPRTPTREDSA